MDQEDPPSVLNSNISIQDLWYFDMENININFDNNVHLNTTLIVIRYVDSYTIIIVYTDTIIIIVIILDVSRPIRYFVKGIRST